MSNRLLGLLSVLSGCARSSEAVTHPVEAVTHPVEPERLDFSLRVSGLDPLEGRTVWAAVMGGGQREGKGARVEGVVAGGAIDVSCLHCLKYGTYYATVAVVADTDDTPGCSPDDRLLDRDTPILIDWDYEVIFWDPDVWGQRARTDAAWVAARPTVADWSDAYDICAWAAP